MSNSSAVQELSKQLWRAVTEYYIRSRATGTMERAHAVQGSPIRSKGCFNCGDPGHMQSECPKPKRCKHCGKSGHVASDCWEKHPDKRPSKKDVRSLWLKTASTNEW